MMALLLFIGAVILFFIFGSLLEAIWEKPAEGEPKRWLSMQLLLTVIILGGLYILFLR